MAAKTKFLTWAGQTFDPPLTDKEVEKLGNSIDHISILLTGRYNAYHYYHSGEGGTILDLLKKICCEVLGRAE